MLLPSAEQWSFVWRRRHHTSTQQRRQQKWYLSSSRAQWCDGISTNGYLKLHILGLHPEIPRCWEEPGENYENTSWSLIQPHRHAALENWNRWNGTELNRLNDCETGVFKTNEDWKRPHIWLKCLFHNKITYSWSLTSDLVGLLKQNEQLCLLKRGGWGCVMEEIG